MNLSVGRLQLDNQLVHASFPVVLYTPPHDPTSGEWAFINLRLVKANHREFIHYFKYFALLVQQMAIKLEEKLLRSAFMIIDCHYLKQYISLKFCLVQFFSGESSIIHGCLCAF